MNEDRHAAVDFLNSALSRETNMRKLRAIIGQALPKMLDEFYEEIGKSPVEALFSDPGRVEPTKAKQAMHWERLFDDQISDETFARSDFIGEVHLKKGLSPNWYITAYGWVLLKMIPEITSKYRLSRSELNAALSTLVVRFFSDMAASLTGYQNASVREAVTTVKEKNIEALGNLSNSITDLNSITLQLAFLQRNSNDVARNGQAISSAATELVSSVGEISTNSEYAAHEAQESNDSAAEGRTTVQRLSQVIANISAAVAETSNSVDELSEASGQIGQMLTVIEGIAEQTNLLALNATIEAARAGEAGKGFAVVASEVKQLANQTAKSTEDIAGRIAALREGMALIQKNMQTSTSAVAQSEEAIAQTSGQIDQFAVKAGGVSTRMSEISGILMQQKTASSEIAENIDNVAQLASESDRFVHKISDGMQRATASFFDNAQEMFDATSPVSLCYMARIDHVMFKKRVLDACMGYGSWQSQEVPGHHDCRLGKWYDKIDNPAIRNMSSFRALVEPHKIVHASAKEALEAAANGDKAGSSEALRKMDDASAEVLDLLDELATAIRTHETQNNKAVRREAVA
jgi:methyl-accepting chemotaxis protein